MAPAWWLSLALLIAPDVGLDHFRAAAHGSLGDADTGALTNGKHYYASNERDLHLFADDVVDRGGLIVAVAADPGYILAAWADADALILVDLDPAIADLHRIYAAFFTAADDIAEFRRLWSDPGLLDAHALIVSAGEARGDADTLLAIFDEARPSIARRFADLERRMADHDRPWLLSDAELYTRVAEMVRGGRVYAFRGDLTRTGIVSDLGRWLDDAELDVSLLYLSNAEQYFMYRQDFRDNMLAIPLAEESLVLRTLPGRPAGFEYIVQDGADFQARIADPTVRSVYRIRGLKRGEHLDGRTRHVVAPAER